ncbi:MAG: stage V sporulation protein B [Clostridiaceae bacterium]|nr:stage V sporulation protein B [Clostridiaceae bacterium]
MLTLSNMATGIIAFVFSIILSRKLGAEGLGLYGLVMPVYALLLCITTDGIITAISKISTVYFSRKEYGNLNRTLSSVFVLAAAWAAFIALMVVVFHRTIAVHFVRDARASDALMILSPALVFVPLSAVIKGYFYGMGQFKITASVDILEKILRVVILLGTIALLRPESVAGTVAIAFFALALGEMISLVTLFICYRVKKARYKGNGGARVKSRIQLFFDVLVISAPLCVNGVLSSVISTVCALILPRRLIAAGFSYREALALIGRFGGMALNISTLPFLIIGSMLTVLVPDVSLNISRKDYWSAEERIAQVMRISCMIGISTAIVCMVIPETLGRLFYQRSDLGAMIRFSAPICLITFISSPTFGILNALGKQNILLKNSLIHSVQNLVQTTVLAGIPVLNIYGYGLSIMLTSVTSFILNMNEIKKICEIKIKLSDIVLLILAGTASWLAALAAGNLLAAAPMFIRAAGIVTVCFAAMAALSSVGFKGRAET